MGNQLTAGEKIESGSMCFIRNGKLYKCKRISDVSGDNQHRKTVRSFDSWLMAIKSDVSRAHIDDIFSCVPEYIDYILNEKGI